MLRLNNLCAVLLCAVLTACASTTNPPSEASGSALVVDNAAFVTKAQQQYGLDPDQVRAALAQARYQAKIIDLMNKPYESQSWAVYQSHMLTSARVSQGKAFANTHRAILDQAQQRYGVPGDVVSAIIGVETFYGKNQGNYYVLDALATLSFAYPKRANFFQSELANYLWICQHNQWPVRRLKGSYAGAFGIGQFMPSSYRQYAVSVDGQEPDISRSPDDAIMSVANYFAKHGWKAGQIAAVRVTVPAALDVQRRPKMTRPTHTVAYWQQQGVQVPEGFHHPEALAELVVEHDAVGQVQAWLILHNFYVIARYNPHLNYTLAVFLLSQKL